jgi:tetratricopeptide (TPR) repeat protein
MTWWGLQQICNPPFLLECGSLARVGGMPDLRATTKPPLLTALLGLFWVAAEFAAAQGGFVVFGRVSLPDGRPATRVKVYVEGSSGFNRDMLSDDQGNYEFRGLNSGRYRVSAKNPNVPEQYSDPAESDTSRAYNNRLQINVYLRFPMHGAKGAKPGTVSVADASQNIPKQARKNYEQGVKFQKENQPDKAMAEFNHAIELYPDYFQALTDRAQLYMQRNQLAEAEADFNRSLKINEKYAPSLRGAGYCQIQQRKFEDAVANLEKAISLEPKVALSHMLLGYANLSLDKYDDAARALQEAIKLSPEGAARAHVYLAETYAHENKYKEAADEIRLYLQAKPDAADARKLQELEKQWRAQAKAPKK